MLLIYFLLRVSDIYKDRDSLLYNILIKDIIYKCKKEDINNLKKIRDLIIK